MENPALKERRWMRSGISRCCRSPISLPKLPSRARRFVTGASVLQTPALPHPCFRQGQSTATAQIV